MGLPEGWTRYGADGEEILSAHRYRALGKCYRAALRRVHCARHIRCSDKEVLKSHPCLKPTLPTSANTTRGGLWAKR